MTEDVDTGVVRERPPVSPVRPAEPGRRFGGPGVEVLDSAVRVAAPAPAVAPGPIVDLSLDLGPAPAVPVQRPTPARPVRSGLGRGGLGLAGLGRGGLGLAASVLALGLVVAGTELPRLPQPSGRALGATAWWNPLPAKGFPLPGSDRFATAVFAPDGRTLAAAAGDGRIQLWDTVSGRMLARLSGPPGLRQMMFSADGRLVSAVGATDALQTWEAGTGRPRPALTGARAGYFPAGHALVSGDASGRVRIWNTVIEEPAPLLVLKDSPVADLTVSPDARSLAVRTEDGVTRVRDLIGRRLLTLPTEGHGELAFSADSRTLITGSDVNADTGAHEAGGPTTSWTIQSWDAMTGRLRSARTVSARSRSARHGLPGIVFSADGRALAAGGRADGVVQIEDADTGRVRHRLAGLQDETVAVLSPDGHALATANRSSLRVWDLATGTVRLCLPSGRGDGPPELTFAPDGRVLAIVRKDADVQLWALS